MNLTLVGRIYQAITAVNLLEENIVTINYNDTSIYLTRIGTIIYAFTTKNKFKYNHLNYYTPLKQFFETFHSKYHEKLKLGLVDIEFKDISSILKEVNLV